MRSTLRAGSPITSAASMQSSMFSRSGAIGVKVRPPPSQCSNKNFRQRHGCHRRSIQGHGPNVLPESADQQNRSHRSARGNGDIRKDLQIRNLGVGRGRNDPDVGVLRPSSWRKPKAKCRKYRNSRQPRPCSKSHIKGTVFRKEIAEIRRRLIRSLNWIFYDFNKGL